MKQMASWFFLLLTGLFLIVVGFTGSVGKIFAVAFAPGLLDYIGTAPDVQSGDAANGNPGTF